MTHNALPLATTSVVLVHGATMDGSSQRPVHDILKAAGLEVTVVQLPLTSLEADVDATLLCIARQAGNVVLVGHYYGGVVVSVAGTHLKVRALVQVAALQPDEGETLATLAARFPSENHMLDLGDGTVILDPVHYAHDMADDIPLGDAAFLAASQRPTAMAVFGTPVAETAWRDKPSFAIVATNDRILHPELARFMCARSNSKVLEIEASHVPHLSHPKAVAEFILGASNGQPRAPLSKRAHLDVDAARESPRTVRFGASGERLADRQQVTRYRKSFYSNQVKVEIAYMRGKGHAERANGSIHPRAQEWGSSQRKH